MQGFTIISKEVGKAKRYKGVFVFNSFMLVFNTFIQLFIYQIFIKANQNPTLWRDTILYVCLSNVIGITCSLYRIPEFSENIFDGSYVRYSIRPIKYTSQFFFMELGESINGLLISTPLLILLLLFIRKYSYHAHIFLFFISFIFAIILSILMTNFFFSITVFTLKNSGPRALIQGISSLLSGSLIPLFFWPQKLIEYIQYLPFALIINGPIEVFLGSQNGVPIIEGQIIWIIIFIAIHYCFTEQILANQKHIGG